MTEYPLDVGLNTWESTTNIHVPYEKTQDRINPKVNKGDEIKNCNEY